MITTITIGQWIDSLDAVAYSLLVAALWIAAIAVVVKSCRR
jgi:hypothetical protein